MTLADAKLDFGYPWWLSTGHLLLAALSLVLLLLAYRRRWRKWTFLAPGLLLVWSIAAFVVVRTSIDVNGRATLPTQGFLRTGYGRVLDMGAGTGRSSIMVLEARPEATVVASDLFGESYDMHFGKGLTPEKRLLANFIAAGVEKRATIVKADMRELPFEPDTFDAVVSSYAIDHLERDGIPQALREAARVTKTGGEFLMMGIAKDRWLQFTFGPLLLHNRNRGPDWWASRVREAGFQVVEEGRVPAAFYVLARKI